MYYIPIPSSLALEGGGGEGLGGKSAQGNEQAIQTFLWAKNNGHSLFLQLFHYLFCLLYSPGDGGRHNLGRETRDVRLNGSETWTN
jgi:hypothetical protein